MNISVKIRKTFDKAVASVTLDDKFGRTRREGYRNRKGQIHGNAGGDL